MYQARGASTCSRRKTLRTTCSGSGCSRNVNSLNNQLFLTRLGCFDATFNVESIIPNLFGQGLSVGLAFVFTFMKPHLWYSTVMTQHSLFIYTYHIYISYIHILDNQTSHICTWVQHSSRRTITPASWGRRELNIHHYALSHHLKRKSRLYGPCASLLLPPLPKTKTHLCRLEMLAMVTEVVVRSGVSVVGPRAMVEKSVSYSNQQSRLGSAQPSGQSEYTQIRRYTHTHTHTRVSL